MATLGGPAWLFCPADRPERFGTALKTADIVIIDLEDSVLPDAKVNARQNIVAAAERLDPTRTVIRLNPLETPWGEDDVQAVLRTPLGIVMLPKSTSASQLELLKEIKVVALCETAAGVLAAPEIAGSPNCVGLCWGGEDLALDLGNSPRSAEGRFSKTSSWGRMLVRYAAAAAGIPAIDTVWTDMADANGLALEADEAAAAGFDGKFAIHPSQVPVIRAAFAPLQDEIERARRIITASELAQARGQGAVKFEGQLIDTSIVERAKRMIANEALPPRPAASSEGDSE